jgi:hypothetical protein
MPAFRCAQKVFSKSAANTELVKYLKTPSNGWRFYDKSAWGTGQRRKTVLAIHDKICVV